MSTYSGRAGRGLAVALLALVLVLDLVWSLTGEPSSATEFGIVDEPAHLLTAALLLLVLAAAVRSPPPLSFALAALVASVAIDLDHIPAELGWEGLTRGTPRPYTHALWTVALFVLLGVAARGALRPISLGVAFGVCAHLLRDLAFGGGVALLWPLSEQGMKLPYAVYAGVLAAATMVALLSLRRQPAALSPPGTAPAGHGSGSRSDRLP
jgi:inner membrane protein